ncbi:tetratricopeptide repeat protein [Vibrio sp. Of7-15]|uniref:YfgM family protein n=1 Tax=Vibrio sp. Of7-15 TaxID=2724879 RepID=UPI001EF2463D|nr:tetratricopeptide repeat protein [Vibrio sp. Of7-15]
MEVYETEEQQVDAIKRWWKENGKAVVLGAVLGLGGLWGWRYYQAELVASKEAASDAYGKVLSVLEAGGDDAIAQTQTFIDAHKDNQYAVLAALQLAKVQVEANKLDEALTQLRWAAANTKDDAILPLATTRIARILAEQGQYDQALAELKNVTSESWKARVAELRGDIALRSGDAEAARTAYTEAQQLGESPALQMKLDDLAK